MKKAIIGYFSAVSLFLLVCFLYQNDVLSGYAYIETIQTVDAPRGIESGKNILLCFISISLFDFVFYKFYYIRKCLSKSPVRRVTANNVTDFCE